MRKSKLISPIITFISVLGFSTTPQAEPITKNHQFVAGDVLVQKESLWKALKVLDIDKIEDKQVTLHVMVFENSKSKPSIKSLDKSPVKIYHAPIAAENFAQSWELLGNRNIENSELVGFIEYLKHTNFQRYAEVTNQNVDELISLANSKYKEAYALGKLSKYNEAIALYSEAVDIFPMFIEAIDNIAFTYMDMGDNENAIKYFDESLRIEPDGYTALYYKGQSYINLGDVDSAYTIFKEGMSRFPEKKSAFEEVYSKLQKIKDMRGNG